MSENRNSEKDTYKHESKIALITNPYNPGFYSVNLEKVILDSNNEEQTYYRKHGKNFIYVKKGNKAVLVKPWFIRKYLFWGYPDRSWYYSPALIGGIFLSIIFLCLQIYSVTNIMREYYPLFNIMSVALILIALFQRSKANEYESEMYARSQGAHIKYPLISDYIRKCENCGTEYNNDELFCSFCGYQLKIRI